MGKSRFVAPDTTTLTLANGDTLVVKTRLTRGDQRAMFARLYVAGVDGELKTNRLAIGQSTVLAYLLDWSLTDDQGKKVVIAGQPVEVVDAALDALSPEDFAEIREAIDAHETAQEQVRAEATASPFGATPSATT